jgi:hypothetical protein
VTTQEHPSLHEPTPQQQLVLERIAAQRERIRARQRAHATQLASRSDVSPAADSGDASMLERLLQFTREHPSVLAVIAAAAVAAGPRRIVRWASVILPLVMRSKRS